MQRTAIFHDEQCSVTPARARILLAIARAPRPPRLGRYSRIAERKLQRDGLLERAADADDAKLTCWRLSDKGERIHQHLLALETPPRAAEPAAEPKGMNL